MATKFSRSEPPPSFAGIFAPALTALSAVLLEPYLTRFSQGREAILPCVMVLLLFALLHPRFRNLLIVTLCYGVAFLAMRDVWFRASVVSLPPALASHMTFSTDIIDLGRSVGLCLVGILAAAAAIGETFRPGTVWARRCYFGAASLYFSGLGVMNYLWKSNWQSLLLCVTGGTALLGTLFTERIVASEQIASDTKTESDEDVQQTSYARHRRALLEKEWHDTSGASQ